jgi:hypothetical protein
MIQPRDLWRMSDPPGADGSDVVFETWHFKTKILDEMAFGLRVAEITSLFRMRP